MRENQMEAHAKLGSTGQYPAGRVNEQDEGEIQLRIGTENGCVMIDYGIPVQWVGMSPQEAVELAGILINRARLISDVPLIMELDYRGPRL